MTEITVDLGAHSYPIRIGRGTLDSLPELVAGVGAKGIAAVVTDSNVAPLYGERVCALVERGGLKPVLCTMPAGEEHKRLQRIEELCGQFLQGGLDRGSLVVALGGGVVGDVAGYAAASFMRGIRFVQVPTTIVAQVDSSVGGKTGVNHPAGKNIIGAFHQPSGVLIDLEMLKSLPTWEIRAGLAEVIKHGVIADADLFAYMEAQAEAILAKDLDALEYPVRRSCEIKAQIVSEDEREHGVRALLNYGHTFGHGVEAVTHYERFLHGEAVALGMQAAAVLSRNLGLVDEAVVARQRTCLAAYGLPVEWAELPVEETLAAMKHDKKARAGVLKFIVVERIGRAIQRTDITESQAREALTALRSS
jgi:3-dehydroquinate synthase